MGTCRIDNQRRRIDKGDHRRDCNHRHRTWVDLGSNPVGILGRVMRMKIKSIMSIVIGSLTMIEQGTMKSKGIYR